MATYSDDPWLAGAQIGDYMLGSIFGLNPESYLGAQSVSSADWAKRWTADLGNLGGYYDQNQVNSLIGSLGAQSSTTYLNQLSALAQESNRLYSLTQNPNQVYQGLYNAAQNAPGQVLQLGWSGFRITKGKGWAYDIMGNRYDDLQMSPIFSTLYGMIEDYSNKQKTIVEQLNAQQQREQSFVTQINQITQQATLAKSQAEQKAAADKLAQQYAQQQAALNQQAAQNAAKLAEQQKQQQAQYEQAQQQQAEQARKQQLTLDTTAQVNAVKNATAAQQAQARVAVSQLEQQAGQVRGGEAQVSTNAAPAKTQRGQTTRTERWQATRQPAPGGGGIRA